MKALVYLMLLSLNAFALEAPIRMSGEYSLKQPVTVTLSWRQEVLDSRTAAGQSRYAELIQAGWQCERRSHYEVCKGKGALDLTSAEIEKFQKFVESRGPLVFGIPQGEPEVYNDAEEFTEYLHNQSVSWDSHEFSTFRIYQSPDLVKVNIVDTQNSILDTFVVEDEFLVHTTKVQKPRGTMVTDIYFIEARFSR